MQRVGTTRCLGFISFQAERMKPYETLRMNLCSAFAEARDQGHVQGTMSNRVAYILDGPS